jgi:hypothetical protein
MTQDLHIHSVVFQYGQYSTKYEKIIRGYNSVCWPIGNTTGFATAIGKFPD